jgi:periplasmic protein TonB
MGYQALLFCPDEKTARTVTQVLSELEFNVEPCVETFAAVKKLMGRHFDAVVVDCDNEQNAALLFKSARNSTSNQTSLAVAVVEGQAGVAKAFRIGANLVLTKPINIEQAKGTLRVARGLLRKGEPAKPGMPAAAVAPATPSAPLAVSAARPAAKPVPPLKPAAPALASPRPAAPPAPTPAWPAHAPVDNSVPSSNNEDLPEISVDDDLPAPEVAAAPSKIEAPALQKSRASDPFARLASAPAKPAPKQAAEFSSATTLGRGAASAPAPARETKDLDTGKASAASATADADILVDKPEEKLIESSHPAPEPPLPTFTFGGNAIVSETSGGSKKILLVVAAFVIVAAAAYAGWSYFQGRQSQPVSPMPNPTAAPGKRTLTANPAPSQPTASSTTPEASETSPVPQPVAQTTAAREPTTNSAKDSTTSAEENETPPATPPKNVTHSAPSKPAASVNPEPAPLVVKGGSVPQPRPAVDAGDAQAPSMVGIATPDGGAAPNLVSNVGNGPTPVLQTVNVSQGVSQGLLIKKVQPIYPKSALTMHIEGAVQLSATISKTGEITSLKALSGDARLARAALDAVKQWKYKPYLLDGEPVEIQTTITLNFKAPN